MHAHPCASAIQCLGGVSPDYRLAPGVVCRAPGGVGMGGGVRGCGWSPGWRRGSGAAAGTGAAIRRRRRGPPVENRGGVTRVHRESEKPDYVGGGLW